MDINNEFYMHTAKGIDGKEISFNEFKGKTLLIVNVASRCGFTKQYSGLENLYQKYRDKNFLILGFPCNQFGGQEPGTEEEIKTFCQTNYSVTFPLFAKIDVNGKNAHPLFVYLKNKSPGILNTERIKWNFTKFLVDKNGKVIDRFASATTPENIEEKIKAIL